MSQVEMDYTKDTTRYVIKTEYWDCSNNNTEGSTCELQCAAHGFELQAIGEQATNGKRKCECNGASCLWTGGSHMICAEIKITSTTTSTTSTTPTTTTTTTTTSTTTSTIPIPLSTTTRSTTTKHALTTSTEADKTCSSQSLSDKNGKWFCDSERNERGTVCELKCYAGFYHSDIKMKRRCVCNKKGKCKWNHKEIECLTTLPETGGGSGPEPIVDAILPSCTPLQSDLNAGYWSCSNTNMDGSRCKLLCFSGFEQQPTSRKCRCKDNSCEWKGPDRQCVAASVFTTQSPNHSQVCETELSDQFGHWDCSNGNKIYSKCKLKCLDGYRVSAGGATRKCRCQALELKTIDLNFKFQYL